MTVADRRGPRRVPGVRAVASTVPELIPVVGAFGVGRTIASELAHALGSSARLRIVADPAELRDLIAREVLVATFLAVPAHSDGSTVQLIAELAPGFRRHRFIGVFDVAVSDPTAILALAQAGLSEIITRARPLGRSDVLPVLARCHVESASDYILARMMDALLPDEHALLQAFLRRARGPVTVQELARQLRVHRRTLTKWTDRTGFVAPQALLGWCRLLLVGYYLEDSGRTIDEIAQRLQFPTPSNCRGFIKRYTGRTASQLRADGALDAMLTEFALQAFRNPRVLLKRKALS